MTSPESTLTTQRPGEPPETRPVPPSWATVAPLLQRWQMALLPYPDGTWDVLAGASRLGGSGPACAARHVSFAALPQAIQDVAARCEPPAVGEGGG